MKRNMLEYEQALDVMVRILRAHASAGAEPLTYGRLSSELALQGHHVPAYRGPMPYLLEDASLRDSRLARRVPFSRPGDDTELWTSELAHLARHHSSR